MVDSTVYQAANTYTNFEGLKALQHDSKVNPELAKKEVSQQFESLLVQMLLKSMRDTNKEFSSDLMHSDQAAMYEDLFDKQLALVLSKSGIGIAKSIEESIGRAQSNVLEPTEPLLDNIVIQDAVPVQAVIASVIPSSIPSAPRVEKPAMEDIPFENSHDFIKTLWSSAKAAARIIGVDPKLLLAQAALETNWGKNIIPHDGGGSTHNLFNIKADSAWRNKSVSFNTIEQRDDVLVKEHAKFRSYDSYFDSFVDYAAFLKQNNRYTEALKNAADPAKFAQSLQDAHYATDTLYSEKILDIFSSNKFNQAFEHLT